MSTSRPPDPLRRMRAGQRTTGLSGVWDRMRAAMKRRNSETSATDDGPEPDLLQEFSSILSPTDADRDVAIVADGPAIALPPSQTPCVSTRSSMRSLPLPRKFEELVPDVGPEGDSEDESDEAMLPLVCTSNRINHARAQEMFAKYGLKYEPRFTRTTDEPPSKIRRVQRRLHMRVRWTCHECTAAFGTDRVCQECGHRRCDRCTKHPPKRAGDMSEDAGVNIDQDSMSRHTPEVAEAGGDAERPGNDGDALRMTSLEEALSEPLEKDDDEIDEDENDAEDDSTGVSLLRELQLSGYRQPLVGIDVVLKPKTQIIRRICHECQTQILPPNRDECQTCGHHRCTLCPRYPPKPEKWPHGSPGDERLPPDDVLDMVAPAVQRVYRKPRQRVRYICEHCRTTFAQRDNCEECGHGRCKDCIRIPPRRPAPTMAEEPPELTLV